MTWEVSSELEIANFYKITALPVPGPIYTAYNITRYTYDEEIDRIDAAMVWCKDLFKKLEQSLKVLFNSQEQQNLFIFWRSLLEILGGETNGSLLPANHAAVEWNSWKVGCGCLNSKWKHNFLQKEWILDVRRRKSETQSWLSKKYCRAFRLLSRVKLALSFVIQLKFRVKNIVFS